MRKQTGFTLIEIAIVLVIVGLLLGGVLKGQELIQSARTRNLISVQDGIKAAFFGFQDRFRAYPGRLCVGYDEHQWCCSDRERERQWSDRSDWCNDNGKYRCMGPPLSCRLYQWHLHLGYRRRATRPTRKTLTGSTWT